MKAFISYSHLDEHLLQRLHVHLAMLRRDGGISEWYDREIRAGGDIDREVSIHLEVCDIFLALLSPDFLNSKYCYEKEMAHAIERHDRDRKWTPDEAAHRLWEELLKRAGISYGQ